MLLLVLLFEMKLVFWRETEWWVMCGLELGSFVVCGIDFFGYEVGLLVGKMVYFS